MILSTFLWNGGSGTAGTSPVDENKVESNLEKRQKIEIMSFFAKPPGQAKLPSAPISVSLNNQAVEYFQKQEYELARQTVLEALKQDSTNAYAYELLGEIYYMQQKLKDAKENYQISYALQPRPEVLEKIEKLIKETQVETKFSTYTEEHFIIKYHDNDKVVEGFELRELLRETYRQISQDFAHYLTYQIVVMLYEDEEFKAITGRPHWSSGLYDGKVRMPVKKGKSIDAELRALTRHEVTHAFVAAISKQSAPAWINEGIAVYEENKERKVDLLIFRSAIKTHTLIPVDQLMSQSHLEAMTDTSEVALFYQESFHLVDYLAARYGMFQVKQMLQKFTNDKTSDEVIREVLQISTEKLESEWKSTFIK